MLDGRFSKVIPMGRAEVMKHKAESRGSDRSDSPWQKWEESMWKKCPLRGLEAYVPTSTEYRILKNMAASVTPDSVTHAAADYRYLPPPPDSVPDGEIIDAEIVDDPPPSNGRAKQEAPKPTARTARRKTATAGDDTQGQPGEEDETPAGPAPDETPASGPARPAGPARATSGQLSMLGQRLGKLGVDDENRLSTLAKLSGHDDLGKAGDLTQDEAAHIRGLLDRCTDGKGAPDRGALVELLATGQLPEAEKAGGGDE
jgi:hypothetical protein